MKKLNVASWNAKERGSLPFDLFCKNMIADGHQIKTIVPTKYNGQGLQTATILYKASLPVPPVGDQPKKKK